MGCTAHRYVMPSKSQCTKTPSILNVASWQLTQTLCVPSWYMIRTKQYEMFKTATPILGIFGHCTMTHRSHFESSCTAGGASCHKLPDSVMNQKHSLYLESSWQQSSANELHTLLMLVPISDSYLAMRCIAEEAIATEVTQTLCLGKQQQVHVVHIMILRTSTSTHCA